jgi:hypothetical protein
MTELSRRPQNFVEHNQGADVFRPKKSIFNLFGGRRRHFRTFSQITKLPTIECGDSLDTIFGPLGIAIK